MRPILLNSKLIPLCLPFTCIWFWKFRFCPFLYSFIKHSPQSWFRLLDNAAVTNEVDANTKINDDKHQDIKEDVNSEKLWPKQSPFSLRDARALMIPFSDCVRVHGAIGITDTSSLARNTFQSIIVIIISHDDKIKWLKIQIQMSWNLIQFTKIAFQSSPAPSHFCLTFL